MKKLSFDEKISEIRKCYVENPQQVDYEVSVCLYNIRKLNIEKKGFLSDVSFDILVFSLLSIVIVCIGFFHYSNIVLYLCGFVFFIAGLLVGLKEKSFGLIFLFSHGMIGLIMMEGALLGDIFSNPIFSDYPTKIIIYLAINVIILLISLIISIIYNLSDKLKRHKYLKCIILFLYFLVFFMTGLFPYVFSLFS